MATINLFGASGHAKVIMDIIETQGDSVGFLYDDAPRCTEIHGLPVLKARDFSPQNNLIISIGNNRSRKFVAERYDLNFEIAIHPSAIVSSSAIIGCGTVVMAGAIIQADAIIGEHCIVNTGASIDHECVLGDYVHISPHSTLCGNVHIGEGSWVGAGAIVAPGIKIGQWCTIGAGSVVVRDIPDGVTAYGNPCKIK